MHRREKVSSTDSMSSLNEDSSNIVEIVKQVSYTQVLCLMSFISF